MPASTRRTRGWTRAHAERLLWRAGFGARPKEIEFWARRSRERTIDWLIRGGAGPHGTKRMVGPAPRVNGKPLDPVNEWGHDMLWWLDKMVRRQRPLQEKLTLFWHDHFATRDQDAPLMLAQNRKLRQHALDPFPELLRAVTTDPATQAFLSLVDSDKRDPNENYARELMELFTLGVTGGYTERDVREAARALTGFKGKYHDGRPLTIAYDPERHDDGAKQLLGHRGKLDWQDVLRLVVGHHSHAPFLVGKLWDFFITEPMPAATRGRLARVYLRSHHRIAPVVREILSSRALYADLDHPQMVKWPIVQLAGNLRTVCRAVDTPAGPATPVGHGMREYRFSLYRPSVHAGTVAFNMTNFGEDAHNLRLSGPGGYRSAVGRDVKPGGHLRFTVHLLRAGTYSLVCLKPGHAAKGMKAKLRVTRRT
jgi:hypothetical protein